MTELETLRVFFLTRSDTWLRNRLETLGQELEDSRDVQSTSDIGQTYSSQRHIKLVVEMRALTDVMTQRKLITARRSPRGAYAFSAVSRRDL